MIGQQFARYTKHLGEFLREAAVLVWVFKVLVPEKLSAPDIWHHAIIGVLVVLLFAVGSHLEPKNKGETK